MTGSDTSERQAVAADVPTARQLRSRLRQARRRHRTQSVGDLLTDVYMVVLFGVMYGVAFVSNAREYLDSPAAAAADAGERYWIVVAALVAVAGLGWQGLRSVGPLLVVPALQSWAVSSPVDRAAWLRPRFVVLLGGAFGAVGLVGAVSALVDRVGAGVDLVVAVSGAGVVGVAATALAVVAQSSRVGRWWPRLLGVGLAGAGAVLTVGVVVAHFTGGGLVRPSGSVAVGLLAVGLPLAVLTTALAARSLPLVDRAALTTGAQFANAAATAAVMLDPSLLGGLLESRRWRGVGRVRSRRFLAGRRWWVLVQAEVRRLRRHPSAVPAWVALILVQYAVAVAAPALAGSAQVIGAYLATDRLTGGLRSLSRSPGLRRALGGDDARNQLAHVVVPGVGAALWWLATLPVGGPSLGWVAVVMVSGVVVAAYRAGTRPPLDYDTPVAHTPFGVIPVGLMTQMLRGWDVVAVLVVARLLLS
ncbi:DUF6297 family protein [Micromonospora sp. NPDC000207]|uniref:DUF6297 family protein n=1 Tax=Micromonospora sp. NPDC000207 TaxID=3154246 RepID=UPI00332F61FB